MADFIPLETQQKHLFTMSVLNGTFGVFKLSALTSGLISYKSFRV